jgi:hypothetical protein
MRFRSAILILLAGISLPAIRTAGASPLPNPAALAPVSGDVLFCDANNNLGLAIYSPTTGVTSVLTSSGLLTTPLGVAVESPTSVLVTTLGPGRLVRVATNSGAQSLVAEGNLLAGNPDGVTIGANTLVYVTNLVGSKVVEVNPANGAQRLVTSGGFLTSPIFLTPNGANHLIVTASNARIVEVNIASGAQRLVSTGGLLQNPQGVVVMPDGDLLVADYEAGCLFRVDPVSGDQALVATGIPQAWGVTLDGQGYAYVSRYAADTNSLVRVNLFSGAKTTIITPGVRAFGVSVFYPLANPDPNPPSPPSGVTATIDDPDGVTLRWTAAPGVSAYRIYRDNVSLAIIAGSESTYFDVPEVGSHEYCISAYNGAGESTPTCVSGFRRDFIRDPRIQFVSDIPGDQGGSVALGWLASEYDSPETHLITGYRIWRRLPFTTGAAVAPDAVAAERRARAVGNVIEYWEPILTLPAGFRQGYGAVVATTQDSLPGSNPYTSFFVSALTSDPLVFHDSAVDSGYSVDNLAPPVPPSLSGAYLPAGGVRLSWRSSLAEDLRDYEVYRGTTRAFDRTNDTFLGATPDTGFTDTPGGAFFYKIVARDVHENRSAAAILSPLEIPTPAFVLDASGDWDEHGVRIAVQLVRDQSWGSATVYRGESPDIALAQVVAEALAPSAPGRFDYVDGDVPPAATLWYWLRASGNQGRVALAGPVVLEPLLSPFRDAVSAPVPNPAREAVSVAFVVGGERNGGLGVGVVARIIDAAGRLVRRIDLGSRSPGTHTLAWDRRDDRGGRVRSGVYQVRLSIGARTFHQRVVFVR